ncbi:hypothetical protein N665_0214s0056 [Sinapis alba]|nr:hypothetical protein N665_0214s0056 [Sinapis alba]KAF8100897.1 hypothetical protein N665_0214s0056 [Sinapis alba]
MKNRLASAILMSVGLLVWRSFRIKKKIRKRLSSVICHLLLLVGVRSWRRPL